KRNGPRRSGGRSHTLPCLALPCPASPGRATPRHAGLRLPSLAHNAGICDVIAQTFLCDRRSAAGPVQSVAARSVETPPSCEESTRPDRGPFRIARGYFKPTALASSKRLASFQKGLRSASKIVRDVEIVGLPPPIPLERRYRRYRRYLSAVGNGGMLSSADATGGADFPRAPVPARFFPSVQYPPLRANIHAAPTPPLSLDPPTIMMLPSADSATEGADFPTAPAPTSFLSCVQ